MAMTPRLARMVSLQDHGQPPVQHTVLGTEQTWQTTKWHGKGCERLTIDPRGSFAALETTRRKRPVVICMRMRVHSLFNAFNGRGGPLKRQLNQVFSSFQTAAKTRLDTVDPGAKVPSPVAGHNPLTAPSQPPRNPASLVHR